jgi:hypothetical protein
MAKRSVVFPTVKQFERYARRTGLTLSELWKSFESQIARQPQARKIIIRGPKQSVTIALNRDLRKLKKQTFGGAELGVQRPHEPETDSDIERQEDAGATSEPSIGDIVDESNDPRPRYHRKKDRSCLLCARSSVKHESFETACAHIFGALPNCSPDALCRVPLHRA